MIKKYGMLVVAVSLATARLAFGDVRLPAIISDHMVLLKADRAPVWGWADPGEEVRVVLNGQEQRTTAGGDGKWRVDLNLQASPAGPFEMVVQGKNSFRIRDVMVGEVWLVSGQSNAGHAVGAINVFADEVAQADDPLLREFVVINSPSLYVEKDAGPGFWRRVQPGSTAGFSATGYFFGKSLRRETGGAVALINNAWGGVRLDRYLSAEAIASLPALAANSKREQEQTASSFEALRAWLKETGREDRRPENLDVSSRGPFTPENGWAKAEMVDGKFLVAPGGEPENGVFWMAAEVDRSVFAEWPSPKRLLLHNNGLFEKIYWNGELIGETTWHNYYGARMRWHYYIRPEDVREGVNYLAIRFDAPLDPAGFGSWPVLDGVRFSWHVKKEFGLPPLAGIKPPPALNTMNVGIGSLFNGMLRPIIPYAIRGVLWYQGEANAKSAFGYRTELPVLINDWRRHWKQERLPFYYCQLPVYREKTHDPGESSQWAELREAQSMTLSVPDTGMAVLIDTGEAQDIHPLAKDVAGERLAKIALAKVYGREIPYSGPIFDAMTADGNKVRLTFRHAEGGLVAKKLPREYDVHRTRGQTAPLVRNRPDSELEGFAICGADRKWVWADARVDGDTVLAWSDAVSAPVAVRYAWADNPTCNLYNRAGLPAAPFRTDNFRISTQR